MGHKHIGIGLLLVFLLASCASSAVQDKDLEADAALGEVEADLQREATQAQEALDDVQADRQRERQEQLRRQITDLNIG